MECTAVFHVLFASLLKSNLHPDLLINMLVTHLTWHRRHQDILAHLKISQHQQILMMVCLHMMKYSRQRLNFNDHVSNSMMLVTWSNPSPKPVINFWSPTSIPQKEMTVMLVTSLCWWLYDGDWLRYWRLLSLCWWFSRCIKSVTNIVNRSPTSQTCHRHASLTSM